MEKNLSEKIRVYEYVKEEKDGARVAYSTKDHYLNATEVSKLLGMNNNRLIRRILDGQDRYPRFYYPMKNYEMRVYTNDDIYFFANYLKDNMMKQTKGYKIEDQEFHLHPHSIIYRLMGRR